MRRVCLPVALRETSFFIERRAGGSARPSTITVNRRRGTAVPPVPRGQEAAASPGSMEARRSIQAGTGRFLERRKAGSKSFDW